jgi:hypothetical protein
MADAWHEAEILSNQALRLVPHGICAGFLAMALGHPALGRPLVIRLGFGSGRSHDQHFPVAPGGIEL